MAAPAVGAASSGWCAPRNIGTPSARPSASANMPSGHGPAVPSRASEGAAQSPGHPDMRLIVRRRPVDDADEEKDENCLSVESDGSYTPVEKRGTTQSLSMASSDSFLTAKRKRRSRAAPRVASEVPTPPNLGRLRAGGGKEAGCPSRSAAASDTGTRFGVIGAGMNHARKASNGRNTPTATR